MRRMCTPLSSLNCSAEGYWPILSDRNRLNSRLPPTWKIHTETNKRHHLCANKHTTLLIAPLINKVKIVCVKALLMPQRGAENVRHNGGGDEIFGLIWRSCSVMWSLCCYQMQINTSRAANASLNAGASAESLECRINVSSNSAWIWLMCSNQGKWARCALLRLKTDLILRCHWNVLLLYCVP